MTLRPPTREEIEAIAADFGLHVAAEEMEAYRNLAMGYVGAAALLDALPDELPPVRYPRTPGKRPPADENPLGAWYVRTRIEGAREGPLAGREIALKDNVMVAGVPMSNGTKILDGYVPPVDATIATRILDAGGTIVGKAVCESFCFSAGSHTSDSGPVRNPYDVDRSAGGSSSGCAALVGAGEVDLAIGGDQGGSIRVPASFCGVCGMKPTHGLVPYTGILPLDPTIDHAGPITSDVAGNALLLQAIAGADGLDGRQAAPRVGDYVEALGLGAEGLRIGVLREGFGRAGGEPDVDEKVQAAAERFARLGAKVAEVSVPLHSEVLGLTLPTFLSGMSVVLGTDGVGPGREDVFVPSLVDHARGWRQRADDLPPTLKTMLVGAELMRRRWGWRYYAKAMNQVRRIRAAYDAAFQELDLLLLPTTPMKAMPLPGPAAGLQQLLEASFASGPNTQPFDHTHHPAMSIPCGLSEGLPVGMMLVGRHFEEATIYRAAQAFEQSEDWRDL
jgi:amidase